MVKGISRQVIVVRSPDPTMFEQAIFVLRDGQQGVSDEALLREANKLIGKQYSKKRDQISAVGPFWAAAGAFFTGLIWFLTTLI